MTTPVKECLGVLLQNSLTNIINSSILRIVRRFHLETKILRYTIVAQQQLDNRKLKIEASFIYSNSHRNLFVRGYLATVEARQGGVYG